MTRRFVRFSEERFNYVLRGDVRVFIPKSGNYRGMRIEEDLTWIRPTWYLCDGIDNTIKRIALTEQARQPAIYLNWEHKNKGVNKWTAHKKCIGLAFSISEAKEWLERINVRYN